MSKIYNVAIIGCGHMGAAHMDDIYYKENVVVLYACDRDMEKAELFRRKYNARKITEDYNAAVEDPEVDIVIISTYPATHLEILEKCIAHKKHVICEKPITTNLEDGRKFVRLVKDNPDVKVLVGHILRHNETYNKVAEMIHAGAIGKPIIMRMVQNHHTMDWNKYLELIKDTSPIVDCGVHYIDIIKWFTGSEVVKISAVGQRTEPDLPPDKYNYGIMTLKMSDGSVAYYEAGWTNTISSQNFKEFVGPRGRINLVYMKDRHTHQEEGDLIEYYKYPEKVYEMINIKSKRKPTGDQFDHLVKMIEEGVPANPTIDEVFASFEIALKADEIIRNDI